MILNKTQNEVISTKELYCRNLFSQSIGLMFHPRQNLVMIFPTERRIKIHTFFVLYPIDIIVADKNKIIVEIKKKLQPWRFWNSSSTGRYVLELAFPSTYYKVGDKVEMKYNEKNKR